MARLVDFLMPPAVLCLLAVMLMPTSYCHSEHQPMKQAGWVSAKLKEKSDVQKAKQKALSPVVKEQWHSLELVATAYNSVEAQTDSTPDIAAWGDRIKPGMKLIAVSRDLLKMGWKRGTRVRISGLEGEYVVLDKMNKRWRKRIDVYMGVDLKAARRFGKRKVVVHYQPEEALVVADNR